MLALAHYFPPFPLQLTTSAYPNDYYAVNYLQPMGEGGKHATYGGFLRDRPTPPGPLTGDWALANARTEVRQARSAHLDGFLVDILTSATDGSNNNSRYGNAIFAAAAAESTATDRFVCIPMIDLYSTTMKALSAASMAAVLHHYLSYPSAYVDADGYHHVSVFLCESWTPDQWRAVIDLLEDPDGPYGYKIRFVPCFNNWSYVSGGTYDGVAHGYALWGNRSPAANPVSTAVSRGAAVHARGKLWVQPVSFQDVRPREGIYDEAANTENLRATVECAIASAADWIQVTTWNDYSEGTQVAPSLYHGTAILDLLGMHIHRIKTGSFPPVDHDRLILTHRKHFYSDTQTYVPPGGVSTIKYMKLRSGSTPARDTLEVAAILTAPGTLAITSGSVTVRRDAPAGYSFHTVPMNPGTQSATLER